LSTASEVEAASELAAPWRLVRLPCGTHQDVETGFGYVARIHHLAADSLLRHRQAVDLPQGLPRGSEPCHASRCRNLTAERRRPMLPNEPRPTVEVRKPRKEPP